MNPEDNEFVESLNCWENNYDVITDNIQKLSGLLSLQIQLLQNVQEEKEHEKNVRHMTLEEQNISRLLNSFEQQISIKLNELREVMKIDGENKVEVRGVNFSVEKKLDKITELLEKLINNTVINAPIAERSEHSSSRTVKSENKDVGVDISEALSKLTKRTRVKEPGKEESIQRVKEIDWSKILETKPKISLLDEKGNDIGVKCDIQKDGSVVCEPMKKDATVTGFSLKEDKTIAAEEFTKMIVKPTSLHFTREGTSPRRKFVGRDSNGKTVVGGYWNDDGTVMITSYSSKHFSPVITDVFKQQVESNLFIKVGTMTDNVLTLDKPVKEVHITKPSTYFVDWFVKNTNPELGCQWLDVHPSNHITHILLKDTYFTNVLTTGYVTDEGKAVYYDQYL